MLSSGDDATPTTNQSDDFPGLSNPLDSSVWARPFEHPAQIGPYRILSVLGEGGMGVVYTAEQRTPVHRQVAIKIIKLGMDTRDVVARFEAERQALAMMDHPNVARVIDAGATDTGRPYFVMDLVKGLPLTTYCDSKQLPMRQRLGLFTLVCDAVQHAHMKGIIHRDLKPTNVLVSEVDGKPIPKVIDFGVAKAISHRLTERTLYTQVGQMVGTLEYMSPEQAERGAIDVDTRTDVYSLGVMLYELLTGVLPFDAKELRSAAYDQMQRIIREVDPPRPSTRITSMGAIAAELAKVRQESVATLAKSLRHELEWIPLKAMRKEREARYATASELADDVRNFLEGRALRAAPESRAYRAKKFLRRNRRAVTAAAAMLLLLVAGVIGTGVQAIRATRAERLARARQLEAEQRFADVRSLARRLVFELHPDIEKLSGSSAATRKLVEISMEYLNRLSAGTSNDPTLLREMAVAYEKLGDIQGNPNTPNLGDAPAAMRSYRQGFETASRALAMAPNDHRVRTAAATARMKIADMDDYLGNRAEAMSGYETAQRALEEIAVGRPNEFEAAFNAAIALPRMMEARLDAGDVAGATVLARKAVARCEALIERFPSERAAYDLVSSAHMNLGRCLNRTGDFRGAIGEFQKGVEISRRELARDPGSVSLQYWLATRQAQLADAYNFKGDSDAALKVMNEVLELARHMVATDPLNTRYRAQLGLALLRTGDILYDKRELDRSAERLTEAVEVYKRSIQATPDDRSAKQMLSVTYGQLALLEDARGNLEASLAARQSSIDVVQALLEAAPDDVLLQGGLAFASRELGKSLAKHGRAPEALAHLRKAMDLDTRITARIPSDDRAARNLLMSMEFLANALATLAGDDATSAAQATAMRDEARRLLGQCRDRYLERRAADKLSDADKTKPEKLEQRLRELDSPATSQATS